MGKGRGGGGGPVAAYPVVATGGGEQETAVSTAAAKDKALGCGGGAPVGKVAVPTAAYGDALMEEIMGYPSTTAKASHKEFAFDAGEDGLGKNADRVKSYGSQLSLHHGTLVDQTSSSPPTYIDESVMNIATINAEVEPDMKGIPIMSEAFDAGEDGLGKNADRIKDDTCNALFSRREARGCGKATAMNRSYRRALHVLVLFLAVLCTTGIASAKLIPPCEVTGLATNIRLFCSANLPSSSCCEALASAVASADGKECLCMVGVSPEIMTMGFATENLVRLHNLCSQHEERFECNDNSESLELDNASPRDKDSAGTEDDDEEPKGKMNHNREPHKYHVTEDGETLHEEDLQEPKQRRLNTSQKPADEQPNYREQSRDPHGSNSSTIGVVAGLSSILVVALVVAAALKYKRQQTTFRQLLAVAVAAAIPALPAQGAFPPLPAQGAVGFPPLPPQAAFAIPPAVIQAQGVPEAQAPQPLAFFPGPAEILSLLGYMALDRIRRRVLV